MSDFIPELKIFQPNDIFFSSNFVLTFLTVGVTLVVSPDMEVVTVPPGIHLGRSELFVERQSDRKSSCFSKYLL